jgi:hypothetical protein
MDVTPCSPVEILRDYGELLGNIPEDISAHGHRCENLKCSNGLF